MVPVDRCHEDGRRSRAERWRATESLAASALDMFGAH
jgi:hypothetical protein